MDPFLEDPSGWADVHPTFIITLRKHLGALVSPNFYVRIEEQVYITEPDEPAGRRIEPDLFVTAGRLEARQPAGAAVAVTPPAIVEPLTQAEARVRSIEIHDARSHEVVTVIEVLSTVNKVTGPPRREAFLRKRQTVTSSRVHWIEIDLLRAGDRPPEVRGKSDYYALLKRGDSTACEVWYFDLRDPLPVIAVPLRPPFEDVPLSLAAVSAETYEIGFYADSVDYTRPVPAPRLRPADAAWVEDRIREWTAAGAGPGARAST